MAAATKNERNHNIDARQEGPRFEDKDETVEVILRAEVWERAEAAAKAGGQTTNEWICAAVAEAIERKCKETL